MIYAVNYDLKARSRNYAELHEAIKGCGDWWHYLGSTWLIDAPLSAAAVWERLSPHIDRSDSVLVIAVKPGFQGWLPKDAWTWIERRIAATAG